MFHTQFTGKTHWAFTSSSTEEGDLTKGHSGDLQQLDRTRSHIPQREGEPDSGTGKRSDRTPPLKLDPAGRSDRRRRRRVG
ncbi:hypothetical protein EYF80_024238 [Liparis tanakae]|uniref:Uncharacterized protein n=1 Tax=Liparis tanakae TaxID=230148 RepID=A0A4Z2HJ26_9TELE|nr:hypothetical protein EYF80_024238 [Liparis tanakae]